METHSFDLRSLYRKTMEPEPRLSQRLLFFNEDVLSCCFWSDEISSIGIVFLHRTSVGGKGSVSSKLKERFVVLGGKWIKGGGDGSMVVGCGSSILVGHNQEVAERWLSSLALYSCSKYNCLMRSNFSW